MAAVEIDVQVACDDDGIPAQGVIHKWVQAAIEAVGADDSAEISVRVVGADEIRTLNRAYRDRDEATNVLSFPAGDIEGLPETEPHVLGDVVVCAAVVAGEAREQGKRIEDHWAHMLVHGTLHLLGYDHEAYDEARAMEGLEARILAAGGVTDPYSGA